MSAKRRSVVRALVVAAAFAAVRCSSSPAAPPPAAPPPAVARLIARIGDATVASYPPRGFDRLTPAQRILAYHLSLATIAGDPIYVMQTSRWAWPVTRLMSALLARAAKLEPAFRDALLAYRRQLFVNRGLHDAASGRKFLPGFARADFEAAVHAAGLDAPAELLTAMFDPKVAPLLIDKTPSDGGDPILASAANHYEGVTSADLASFVERYPQNGRVVKRDGRLVEEVYRAGGEGAPPGLGSDVLERVVRHLSDAIPLAPPAQAVALRHLVRYLRTGDAAAFRDHDVAWVKQAFPVDYILGFLGTNTDVRGRKATFTGLVLVADPERDPPLQALARSALELEQRLPYDARYKRVAFPVPAASAAQLLAVSGFIAPRGAGGVALPDAQDLREQYGTKNFFIVTGDDVAEDLAPGRVIDAFVPREHRAEYRRCIRAIVPALTSLHEVLGHGSGKVSPDLTGTPEQHLAPYFDTLEEARADLVAHWLALDPKVTEIGLLPDAGCARTVPHAVAAFGLMLHAFAPPGDTVEEDHDRARLLELNFLRERGAVTIDHRQGELVAVVTDEQLWRRTVGELLAELQRIKATGDKPAIEALVRRLGVRLDPELRREASARVKLEDVPHADSFVPSMLVPVRDAAGRIVDVRAEQTTSLDAYIAWFEEIWRS